MKANDPKIAYDYDLRINIMTIDSCFFLYNFTTKSKFRPNIQSLDRVIHLHLHCSMETMILINEYPLFKFASILKKLK